ncbi:MAG: glycosyltransferase family protein [Phycisphaerae bacterium]
MNVVVVIQARMDSTRLPGKVLMPLGGKPAIAHVLERAGWIPGVSRVVLATTNSPADDPLVDFCHSVGAAVFRGSEEDVLDRYYQAARRFAADVVVRVTGDCPLLAPEVSGAVVRRLLESGADYSSNVHPPTYPDGLDTEALTFAALERAWRGATQKSEREHVTLHVASHPERFRLVNVAGERDLSALRLTLDEEADYRLLGAIFAALENRGWFGSLAEVMAVLDAQPELLEINRAIGRNEGLAKSLAEDGPAGAAAGSAPQHQAERPKGGERG